MRKRFAAICVAPYLSACFGGDIVTPSEARALERRASNYDIIRAEVVELPNTAWVAMPTSGEISMVGVASLRVGPPEQRTALVGDAVVSFSFGTGAVDGQLDRFFGVDSSRDLSEYRGSISLSAGAIGVDRPNDWRADYRGELRGNGDRINMSGRLIGDFVGTPIKGATASAASDEVSNLNGQPQPVNLDIAIQR